MYGTRSRGCHAILGYFQTFPSSSSRSILCRTDMYNVNINEQKVVASRVHITRQGLPPWLRPASYPPCFYLAISSFSLFFPRKRACITSWLGHQFTHISHYFIAFRLLPNPRKHLKTEVCISWIRTITIFAVLVMFREGRGSFDREPAESSLSLWFT